MKLLTLFITLFCLSPLQAITVHYMWGLWDNFPLPQKYQEIQNNNQQALKADTSLHQKEDILHYVRRFSEEFDPAFFELFEKIPRKVSQADLGRYIIIYYLGGMYLDLDVRVKHPKQFLADLDYPNGVWLTEHVVPVSKLGPREKPYGHRIAQFAFYIKGERSHLLLEIIHEAINRVRTLFHECGNNWSDNDVLWASGPDVVTTLLHETSEGGFKVLDLSQSRRFLVHEAHGTWRNTKDH